jgi:hypothetical protein
MDRSVALPLIALVLAGYGIWTALYLPGLLIGPVSVLLLICFIAQAVFAIVAAVGVWGDQRWAWAPVILLGASIAATQLVEILLGIVPFLRAVLLAVLAIVAAILLSAYLRRGDIAGQPSRS